MNDDIVNFSDYCYVYKGLNNVAQEILSMIDKILAADKEAFQGINVSKEDSSIIFLSCGFRIKIDFVVNASDEIGYINWYHILFDQVEQRKKGKLICQQFFDYRGYIYKEKSKNSPLFGGMRGFDRYFQKIMLEVLRKIDKKHPML